MTMRLISAAVTLAIGLLSAGGASAADDKTAGRVFKDCKTCPEVVVIPTGTFTMGSDAKNEMRGGESRPEGPAHQVTIAKPFAAGKTEVTNAQYREFIKATGHTPGRDCSVGFNQEIYAEITFEGPLFGRKPADNEPAVCVSWNEGKMYAAWLSGKTGHRYRLLTEAEWEYVARAGSKTKWPWGDNDTDACKYENTFDLDTMDGMPKDTKVNWKPLECRDGQARIAPVGKYLPNAFGLYDVLGNVWEWVEDCSLELYPAKPNDGSAVEVPGVCEKRGVRGGSWYTRQDRHRMSFRGRDASTDQAHHFGLRIARDLE